MNLYKLTFTVMVTDDSSIKAVQNFLEVFPDDYQMSGAFDCIGVELLERGK